MAAVYESEGLQFPYPENWQVEETQTAEGWSVTLQSPDTAFLLINVHNNRLSVKEVLANALTALREDYPDLESTEATETIAHHRALGYDIQFFSLDMTNTCWIRSFRTTTRTVLILCQATDAELEIAEPILQAIRRSLELAEN